LHAETRIRKTDDETRSNRKRKRRRESNGRIPQLTFSRSRGAGQLRYSSELNAADQKLVHGLAERGYTIAFYVLQTHAHNTIDDKTSPPVGSVTWFSLTSSAAVRGPGAFSMSRISVSVSKCLRKNVDFFRGSSADGKYVIGLRTRTQIATRTRRSDYRASRSSRRNICTRVCSACRPCARSKATSKRAGS